MKYRIYYKIMGLAALLSAMGGPTLAQDAGDVVPETTPMPAAPTAAPAPVPEVKPEARGEERSTPVLPDGRSAPQGSATKTDLDYLRSNDFVPQSSQLDTHAQRNIGLIRRIMVLRQLLTSGFTASDIGTVLPLLRSLRDIRMAPPADPEQAMREEYEALLKASPGAPLPPSSVIKITDAARYYYEEQARIWNSIVGKLGVAKAEVLRRMLGQIPKPSGADSAPIISLPRTNSRNGVPDASLNPPAAGASNSDSALPNRKPESNQIRSSAGVVPLAGEISADQEPAPSLEPKSDLKRQRTPEVRETPGGPVFSNGRAQFQLTRPVPAVPGTATVSLADIISPATVRIPLPELIDLLQAKLAAMSSRSGSPGTAPNFAPF